MQYGFMMVISPREPILRFVEICKRAEDLGFDMAWLGESQLIAKDAYVALALAANATSRIKMGPGVANPVTRHYTALANTIAALNEVSGGRAILGIGVGDSAVRTLNLNPASLKELAEGVEAIRQLSRGQELVLTEGKVRMLTAGEPFPIFISASQPKMLQLAGAVADGVILMGGAEPGITQWQIDHISEGTKRAGRRLDDVFIDLWFAISISDDEEKARQDVRPWATSQARQFAQWRELPRSLQPYVEEFQRIYQRYDFYSHLSRHSEHSKEVSDSFVDSIAVSGPLEKCVRKIEPLLDLKIDRITFALLSGGRLERLRQLGEELIPLLRKVK